MFLFIDQMLTDVVCDDLGHQLGNGIACTTDHIRPLLAIRVTFQGTFDQVVLPVQ